MTGDLDRYEDAGQSLARRGREDGRARSTLVADNPPQQAGGPGHRGEAAARVAWQDEVAGLVRDGRRDEAAERVKDPAAPERLDAIRGGSTRSAARRSGSTGTGSTPWP